MAIALSLFLSMTPTPVMAQQLIPQPDFPFTGEVGLTYDDSIEAPAQLKIPQNYGIDDPPNILLVMIDDVGYGQFGTFGGATDTPALDQVAENGLRYTQFHTTALCAPTRAALLTGHNHHSAGTGIITRLGTGFPGYNSLIPANEATFAETLQEYGYATAWFGKTHNVPDWQTSMAGPYDQWPTHMGFDYYYGFVGGDTFQFAPALVENTTRLEVPKTNKDGSPFHLTTSMADHAIDYIHSVKSANPDKPFFVYFATAATHSPHHVPKAFMQDYLEKYETQDRDNDGTPDKIFDQGWDEYRKTTLAKQIDLGVVPEGTTLTPMPTNGNEVNTDGTLNECTNGICPWNDLDPDEQPVYADMAKVFAAFTEHTDSQVKRVIDAIEELGEEEFNNTMIIYIAGDNGSSAEGELDGLVNEITFFNQVPETFEDKEKATGYLDSLPDDDNDAYLGGPLYYNHMPAAWAWAMDTPFQWNKQIASHFGGTRNGMAISWPKRIKVHDGGNVNESIATGERLRDVRYQFSHVIDIAPTIYEAIGIEPPTMVNGVTQKPLEGTSLAYTFDEVTDTDNGETADGVKLAGWPVDTNHNTQYFEMFGNQGIYHDGWMASALRRAPWLTTYEGDSLLDMNWELYNIDEDFSQANNLADENPEQLEYMEKLFLTQASLYNVLPLDDRQADRQLSCHRPSLTAGRKTFTYYPGFQAPEGATPDLKNKNHRITAEIKSLDANDEGMLITEGGRFAGFGLFIRNETQENPELVYYYNYVGLDKAHKNPTDLMSELVPAQYEKVVDLSTYVGQDVTVNVDFRYGGDFTDGIPGGTATVNLSVNSNTLGTLDLPFSLPYRMTQDENFVVGFDDGTPIVKPDPDHLDSGISYDDDNFNDITSPVYEMPFKFTGTLDHVTIDFDQEVEGGSCPTGDD